MKYFIFMFTILTLATSVAATKIVKADLKKSKLTWIGKKVTGQHNGTIVISEASFQIEDTKFIGGEVLIDMKTIKNLDLQDSKRNKDLTAHLNADDFFGTIKYPTSKLKIITLKNLGGDNYEVLGDLTIKDKTNKITFPAKIAWQGDIIHSSGTMQVDRTLYDIKYKSLKYFSDLGDKVISDFFELSFEIITI